MEYLIGMVTGVLLTLTCGLIIVVNMINKHNEDNEDE